MHRSPDHDAAAAGPARAAGGEPPAAESIPEPDPRERALAHTLGLPDPLARVLLARGLDDPDRIRSHLRPDLRQLGDPFRFKDMARAVERIHRAVASGERIVIHGDYDVDGIAGTVLLLKFFRLIEAEVEPHIPDRRDGYSFTEASLQTIRDGGFTLCISVDNGTNAVDVIDRIQQAGCDVIVTDHHGTSEGVAPAHTVLNPRLPDAGYPDRDLAGVGVGFCLAKALARSFSRGKTLGDEFRDFLIDAMSFVALGTVADVAPLRGENRILVHHGLRALAESGNPGIRALLDSANLGNRAPDAEDIAFRIAPLLNAAGRMGQAREAVELLMASGYQEAQEAAKVLESHNEARRRVERKLVDEVMDRAGSMDDPILVLGDDSWHPGVLGIVASRIAETLHKPAILIAFDGGRGRGSGRSGGTLNLRDALAACSGCLIAHGGHAAAVGLEIARDRLDEFRNRINEEAGDRVRGDLPLRPDGRAEFPELDPKTVRKLDQLGPFGAGNRRPSFVTDGVRLIGRPLLDGRGQDLRLRVAQGGIVLPARLKQGAARFEEIRNMTGSVRVVYSARLSQWAEDGPVELYIHDLRAGSGDN